MNDQIKGRTFLVGCPRSGTTLLQCLIATQPQVMSFPETHFFSLPGITRLHFWGLRFGYVPHAMRQLMQGRLQTLLKSTSQTDVLHFLPKRSIWIQDYVNAFVMILDRLTTLQDKSYWLEKTPSHLYFVEFIERTIPDARFIHLVRNGPDVVASLFEVTGQNPSSWRGEYNIDRCLDRWHKDLQLTQRHLHKANHMLVEYEQLIKAPETTMSNVCDFIGISLKPDLLGQHRMMAEALISENETWKDTARQRIRHVHREKFDRIFSPDQQAYILQRINPAELET